MITVEVICQRSNGGCDQVCTDVVFGVSCSCNDGYQLVDEQTCAGTKAVTLTYHIVQKFDKEIFDK